MQSLKTKLAPTLETPRLRLELFNHSPTHYSVLLAAMNSPTAHARMGDLGIRTTAEFDALNRSTRLAPAALGRTAAELAIDTDVYYLMRVKAGGGAAKDEGPLVGGVSLAQRGPRLPPDVGWCMLEQHHGRGYASEAAHAFLTSIRGRFGVKEVMAWPGQGNQPSRRTAEKAGMVLGGTLTDVEGKPHVVYVTPGTDFGKIRGEAISLFGEAGGGM